MSYWPWWISAPAMSAVVLSFARVMGRPLGVSGSWTRIVQAREERAARAAEQKFDSDAALEAALAQATLAEFGAQPQVNDEASLPSPVESPLISVRPRAPVSAHVVFLIAIMAGAALATLVSGAALAPRSLGHSFDRMARGPAAWALLFGGGLVVGFGTRMAGGCTTGHGLSGCGRLQPGSLVTVAVFFATAVAAAFIAGKLFS
jgi:uncharacterized membrane protein YedE/YeeE